MDFVRQDLPLAFRAFCSTSDIHIVCGCQRKALVRGQNEEDVKIFPGPNPSCRAQTAVLNKSDNRSGYGRGPYLRRAGFCLTSPWSLSAQVTGREDRGRALGRLTGLAPLYRVWTPESPSLSLPSRILGPGCADSAVLRVRVPGPEGHHHLHWKQQ